uniref:Uncharacterized protein n=1 Tax=Ditylenchus dipsaci TaxID=166011 RepID=A0A915DN24_9BILA
MVVQQDASGPVPAIINLRQARSNMALFVALPVLFVVEGFAVQVVVLLDGLMVVLAHRFFTSQSYPSKRQEDGDSSEGSDSLDESNVDGSGGKRAEDDIENSGSGSDSSEDSGSSSPPKHSYKKRHHEHPRANIIEFNVEQEADGNAEVFINNNRP